MEQRGKHEVLSVSNLQSIKVRMQKKKNVSSLQTIIAIYWDEKFITMSIPSQKASSKIQNSKECYK